MEKIFFKHIPRTAGISFIESLQEIYKDDFYHVNYESIIDIPLNKSCIAGRINNIDNRHNITIIRNPVDRAISQFFHEISVFKKYDKKYNIKNLNECFIYWISNNNIRFSNFQSRILTKQINLDIVNFFIKDFINKKIDKSFLFFNLLKNNYGLDDSKKIEINYDNILKKYSVIGTTDNYEKFLKNTTKLINNNYHEIKFLNKNYDYFESHKTGKITILDIKNIKNSLSDEIINHIIDENNFDIDLYNKVRTL